jgi:predicted AlkP superfamily phosphohydrolase/phosphomutase
MPNMGNILSYGTLRRMESSIPDVSCVAWSTVITGKNPGEHGIYGFMNLSPETYRFSFPTFKDLKSAPLWERLPIGRAAVLNVPGTYPARSIDGVMISGFVAVDLERSVYPNSLLPKLRDLGYRIDVDAAKGHTDMDAFLRDCDDTLEAQIRAFRYLWEREEWGLLFLVFTSTDRLSHFLFEACDKTDHPHHEAFRRHFGRIDEIIGEIYGRLGEDDFFMMLSDHGFGTIEREVNVNYYLKEQGFLNIVNPTADSFEGVGEGSRAFALDPARIYVNAAGRYPRGCVSDRDRARLVDDLEAVFKELKIDGRPVVRRICRREDTFSGPHTDHAPDLVVLPHRGFDLKARLTANQLATRGVFTGAHTQDNAFLFVRSHRLDESAIPANPWVGDVSGVVESCKS